ncbi:hypothetical protein Tco_1075514 [Tanacetum coccineum]
MSDMIVLHNDLSYIPPNNEQNEPTQGDIGETGNELTQAKRNEFEELYDSANEELYPGCDYVTRFDFMAKFTYFKVKGKLTDSIFNEMLEFFQHVFPTTKGYKLPPSYYAIKKTFKTTGLGYDSIHACVNDCFLFRGDNNKDVHFCPVCKTSRWKDSNVPGKKVPKKVLCYFPIIPRLQRLYKSSHIAKEMTWHAIGKCTEPGKMQHPVDGSAWKNFDTKYPNFAKEPRNIQLGLAADGFNPFGNLSQAYSMWPVILTTYNLPLWCETIDVATGLKFNMRAMVLWTINDFPARSSLSGWSGQVTRSCPPYVMHIEKNVLESILNTLLMNDKSKDTAKARQDLKSLGIRSGLWLGQNKNGKCSKPQAAYSFTPADRKKFCQFIKGVKLPDGFGSNFKHKVTDNDTNITGLKSHDCHIMMQRLLPYGLQQYLPPDVAKPLIELCLFFKQICSQTLMVDDMLKAQSKVIDILCNLELIYPPAFFDIMIHLVIHLPLEAIFGGPIRPRWMYPFERYMKKLKNYVRNKAKPEGSIAEGYVAEEALTFSSHYFRDVTMKFNHPDRNVDCPPLTCQFQVFKSLCKSIGLRSVIRIDHQELKKVIWYVLHNSPEIDTYQAKFKSEFSNKDMKKEFPSWFGKQIRQRHVDNDPGVSESSELFALACGPSQTPISVNSCVVNGVRFVVHNHDERCTTQNSGIVRLANGEAFKNDQYILATQVKQCFYLEDMARRPLSWKVVEHVSHKKFLNGGVIVVEDDPDVIHVDNSSDLALSTSLNDLEIAALHIDGQSLDVDAPPDIIDVVDEDNYIIDEEDPIPHDLADSDDEDLVNLDIDDGVNVMSAAVARGHDDDGGGKGTRKPNLGGRRAGRPHTRQETRNLGLKAITDKSGPVPIRFEVNDRETLMPLGDHAAHWANYLGELVRELPLHYPSWRQMSPERKAGVVAKIGKLKNYVRNKAKPEGSIAEGYVAEEALTFSSHYFRDVTTKFNRPDRNVDCPPPTCQFQVFKSLCKSIGLRSVIRIDHQELKKVIWYVLHNSPEIDTYRAKFKIEFPNKDMKEEFPGWFGKQIRQRHVDNDPGVNESSELFALACGPSQTPISVNSCVVNGVRFVVHSRDERRTTQNSGICSPGPDGEMYYGQLEQILEFSYLSFKTVLFRVKWFDTSNKGRIQNFVIRNNITQIKANGEAFKNDQYILATQVKQCFYLEDMARRPLGWKVVEHVSHKKFLNGGVIVVEDDPDVIHVDNSSDLALSTSLNDLEIAALHIDGQSIDVDAPPDIIDVVDEDDDIIDEEDPIPHDLADSDDEDLMSADVARGHGGDGGGDDRPPPYQVPTDCGGCLGNRGKGTRKPNLGGRRAGRLHTRQETRNLGLKAITDKSGPVPIWFEVNDRETLMPLGDHAAHWGNYLRELVRELPLHYPSWREMPPEQKAGVVAKIGT